MVRNITVSNKQNEVNMK